MVRAELAARTLRHFVAEAWRVVEPATPFISNWHIDCVCDHMEAVFADQIQDLLIAMPPRCMKSYTVSVFAPAWRWIHKPSTRFLHASYADKLSIQHSIACRDVIRSPWYQRNWGEIFQLKGDQDVKTRFDNTRRGFRITASIGGGI